MNKQQYGTLDLFRLLAAVMVMAIHTAPLESVNSELDYIFGIIIPRVAVPFFFMVVIFLNPAFFFVERYTS